MSLFSKLFGSSDERKAKRIIKQTEHDVIRTTKPLGDIATAIIKASYACSQKLNSMLNIPDEKGKKEAEVLVFYEFIYFFMHLTMRSAFSQMNENQIERFQGFLGPLISSTAVDSFFAHWPEELKVKISSEFYDKLNDAELEYSTSKELLSEENPLTGESLLSKLGRNVAELSGNSMNPVTRTFIISSAVNAYKEMNLDSLVREATKVL